MFDMVSLHSFANQLGQVIGFLAGSIVLYSGWPALKDQWKTPRSGTDQERLGCLLLGLGNFLWMPSAVLTGSWAMVGMAAVNAFLRLMIWVKMRKQHRMNRK